MKYHKLIGLSLFSLLFFGSCETTAGVETDSSAPVTHVAPISARNKVIYELNVRNYSAEGNFAAVTKDLPRLKDLGVDIIWLMPIHPIGELNRAGSLGSPYAVKDYKAVNPEYGTASDFKALVDAAHAQGIEVWIDWVANHTAWDHPWVKEHLDYYAEKDGKRPYAPNGWNDVAELDYSNPALRAAMIDAIKYWVKEFNIDGYRFDAVSFVPLDFWQEARPQVDAVKKVTWLAESDNADYMKVFDYDYAWQYNDELNKFGTGSDISGLVAASKALHSNTAYKEKGKMIYLTNHDLNSHIATEFSRYGANVLPLTVLSYTIYDLPLIYNGQEVGMNKMLSLFDKDPVVWQPANKIYLELFRKLNALKHSQPALEDGKNRGSLNVIPVDKPNVFVYSRKRGDNEVLVMLNFNTVAVKFYWNDLIPSGSYRNYLTGENASFSKDNGITLMEKGYAVFVK